MHDLIKAQEIYEYLRQEDPEFDHKMMLCFKKKMPHEFAKLMYEKKYGHHIYDREMYNEGVDTLKWVEDKGKGAKWTYDEVIKLSNINFGAKKYNECDYAYVVNRLYSLYCNVFTEPSYYLKMAKNYLEDPNYPGDPSERAYHCIAERQKYKEEAA